jgi:hypothetical protein
MLSTLNKNILYPLVSSFLFGNEAHQATPSVEDEQKGGIFYNLYQALTSDPSGWDLLGPLAAPVHAIYYSLTSDDLQSSHTIATRLANDGNLSQLVDNVLSTGLNSINNVLKLVPNTLNTTNWLVSNLPLLLIVGIGLYIFTLAKK